MAGRLLRMAGACAVALGLGSCGLFGGGSEPPSVTSQAAPVGPGSRASSAGGEPAPGADEPRGPGLLALIQAGTRGELLARDELLSFTPQSGVEAAEALDGGHLEGQLGARAAALFAIGAAGSRAEQTRLEANALEGELLDRQAALFALGLLGETPYTFFAQLVQDERILASSALLACAGSPNEDCRAWVEDLARRPNHPAVRDAISALTFARIPASADETVATRTWLELRWAAAQRYGLVAGQGFDALVFAELLGNENFLDHVVLRTAAELQLPGIRDHLVEHLMEHGGAAAARAAAVCLSEQLDMLVAAGVWRPKTPGEWSALVSEIAEQGNAEEVVETLKWAARQPDVSAEAGLLLLGAGFPEAFSLIEEDLSADDPALRARVADALGHSGDEAWIGQLDRMLLDEDPGVAAAARVAQMRLDHAEANEHVRQFFLTEREDWTDEQVVEFEHLAIALVRAAVFDRRMLTWLDRFFALAEGETLLRVATPLARHGRQAARATLRDGLLDGGGGTHRGAMAEALSINADQADLDVLRAIFPDTRLDPQLNVALGLALVANDEASGIEILRAALWRGPWNRSVLAGAILVDHRGVQALHDELLAAPPGAHSQEYRRIGFAIGQWGGLDQVERLARGRGTGDPALQGAYLGALSSRTFP